MSALYGGLEGGGTKFICAVGRGPNEILDEIRIPTTSPEETLARAVDFFRPHRPAAIGLACFGPLVLDEREPAYGQVAATPKPGWAGADLLTPFRQEFDVPLAFEIDVNAAAFGEYSWLPENRRLDSLLYYTIGTGVGAGLILNGRVLHGLTHPEAGHVLLPRQNPEDSFPGICPFHGSCLEGLASGSAIARRWGQSAETLPEEHPAWKLETEYIALALANAIFTLSPQRIVLGGGVMARSFLFPLIRNRVRELLNGYIGSPVFAGSLENYIVPPGLGHRSGVLGALALAIQKLQPAGITFQAGAD